MYTDPSIWFANGNAKRGVSVRMGYVMIISGKAVGTIYKLGVA